MSIEDDYTRNQPQPKVKKGNKPFLEKITSGASDAFLAGFFRKIIDDIGIDGNGWNFFMRSYLHDKRNGIPQNNRDMSSARGNIQKELFKPGMTWKVFCKGLRFMKINKFHIVLTAYHDGGEITEHATTLNIGGDVD